MSLHIYLERLKQADNLISRRATGTLSDFAKKLKLSKSGTEKFIKEMKEEGFPIYYNKKIKSYDYLQSGKMVNKLFVEELDDTTMRKVVGGKSNCKLFAERNYSRFLQNNFVSEKAGDDTNLSKKELNFFIYF